MTTVVPSPEIVASPAVTAEASASGAKRTRTARGTSVSVNGLALARSMRTQFPRGEYAVVPSTTPATWNGSPSSSTSSAVAMRPSTRPESSTGTPSPPPSPASASGSGVASARPACTSRISAVSMTMSVVERCRPSMASCDPRVEYTGAIASTPGTARNSSSCASVNGRPDTAASAPTCSAAERSMPARTVPSSTDENTATETPTTTASTGTSPALGSRSARADPRKGTSPGRAAVARTSRASGIG